MRQTFDKEQFQKDLLQWYEKEKRDLPWRRTSNPYYIWISEIMLQQTRVDTVIPYYLKFIERFPTMESLAEADEEELLKLWEGLGYYSRVRNLQIGVREVVEHYGSEVPKTRKEISSLKGIGPYTAGAILSIAYNLPEHAVDGNVMRVYSRLFEIPDDISKPKTKKIFDELVTKTISHEDPSSFNQAIMELGAVVCTPRNPHCLLCPVQEYCAAYASGTPLDYPVKKGKTKVRKVDIFPFVLQDEQGRYLMRKRPSEGLLANMWEFPYVERASEDLTDPQQQLEKQLNTKIKAGQTYEPYKHIFSHLHWNIYATNGRIVDSNDIKETATMKFFTIEEMKALPMAVPVQVLFKQILNHIIL